MDQHSAFVAVVQRVLPGNHGRFAIATCDTFVGSITFSLDSSVWLESSEPTNGMWVVLENLTRKPAGWRALSARFYRPSDEDRFARPNGQQKGAIVS